jgi:hypothetical protein
VLKHILFSLFTMFTNGAGSLSAVPVSFVVFLLIKTYGYLYLGKQQEVRALIMVNGYTAFRVAFRVDWLPFAGLKESGLGTGGIPHTIKDMQVEKMLVLHSAEL